MFRSVLVVCVGNICRSPVGERMLRAALPGLRIDSAGIGAVVGAPADPVAAAVAAARGVSLEGHVARQFDAALAAQYDLILTMEPGHRREIARLVPQVSGKCMLFDQWTGGRGIEDPFRKSEAVHARVQEEIAAAAAAWAARLAPAAARG
jgi:protein-tyrosine phosphatase